MVFQCDVPAATGLHINYKEVIAAVSAIEMWAHKFVGKTVVIHTHTDSTATKGIINKGRTVNAYINSMLRKLFWVCVKHDVQVIAVSVSGVLNQMADTISRLHERGKLDLLWILLSNWFHAVLLPINLRQHMSNEEH